MAARTLKKKTAVSRTRYRYPSGASRFGAGAARRRWRHFIRTPDSDHQTQRIHLGVLAESPRESCVCRSGFSACCATCGTQPAERGTGPRGRCHGDFAAAMRNAERRRSPQMASPTPCGPLLRRVVCRSAAQPLAAWHRGPQLRSTEYRIRARGARSGFWCCHLA